MTSTIGSFPLEDSEDNRRRCIDDLLRIGIDFPAYPQLIGMGDQFLRDLASTGSGLVSHGDVYRLVVSVPSWDIRPIGLDQLVWAVRYLSQKGLRAKVRIKAPITGPFTLASFIQRGGGVFPYNTASSDPKIVDQLTDVLEATCREASKYAEMISIDEPVLGILVGSRILFGYSEDYILSVFSRLRNACGDRLVGTHICGRIPPRLAQILLRSELDFLSHEFHDTPENINVYHADDVRDRGKILSVGCLSTSKTIVETPEEVLALMNRFREYGSRLIFTPDCGFRKLASGNIGQDEAYMISVKKLESLVAAIKRFNL
ncbi:MAG: uroporphyrinogen decarboxylase family protein [Nitrososphaerota archaeon]|nr:hypothetical protein [Candidatus Bathyarchaeota archaeon]MDW8049081.1 uroporphyrinogen decarboxylase family protein [Nitrososphaerota archaeon]